MKINDICLSVLKLTDDDFKEVETAILSQKSYSHPLKNATVKWQHDLAEHNQRVLDAVRNLKNVIEQGKDIKKPSEALRRVGGD